MIQVFRQIGVNNVRVAPAHKPVHFLDGIGPAAAGPIAVSAVLKVRLEDRFQHQFGSGLNHPVPDRRHGYFELHIGAVNLWDRPR